MIFFDGVHLLATTLEELHAAAREAGLRQAWFQVSPPASYPHYDAWGEPGKRLEKKYGKISTKDLLERYKKSREGIK